VEDGGWRVEGGGWRVEGGGWRVEGGGICGGGRSGAAERGICVGRPLRPLAPLQLFDERVQKDESVCHVRKVSPIYLFWEVV
jgi:hypothetical protein